MSEVTNEMHLQVATIKAVECRDQNLSFRAVRSNLAVGVQRLNKVRKSLSLPPLATVRVRSLQEGRDQAETLMNEVGTLRHTIDDVIAAQELAEESLSQSH